MRPALVKGQVENISSELICGSEDCTYYEISYTAVFRVSDVLKGNGIMPGQTIEIHYEDVVFPADGSAPPGFQGHSPVPQEGEEWAVFLREGFKVAPPNGWWNKAQCW